MRRESRQSTVGRINQALASWRRMDASAAGGSQQLQRVTQWLDSITCVYEKYHFARLLYDKALQQLGQQRDRLLPITAAMSVCDTHFQQIHRLQNRLREAGEQIKRKACTVICGSADQKLELAAVASVKPQQLKQAITQREKQLLHDLHQVRDLLYEHFATANRRADDLWCI